MRALYGTPPLGLIVLPSEAVQVSPLVPGSAALEAVSPASLDQALVCAPAGTLERDHVLALTLRALKPGAAMIALALKDRGGTRLRKTLEGFGCAVIEEARRHHRICQVTRPGHLSTIELAIARGAPRRVGALWTQPGVFSWDRLDPGSALLIATLPPLKGRGADLGCGLGVLALKVLESPAVTALTLIDRDRRAVEAARQNVTDPRAVIEWSDVRSAGHTGLDFVVMNPPFHDGGTEDRALGAAFIAAASAALRPGGVCWLTANRHLPYEAPLAAHFASVTLKAEAGGFKIYQAIRP